MGAFLISILQNVLSGYFGEMWQVVLGVMLLFIVTWLPKGIVGSLIEWQDLRRMKKTSDISVSPKFIKTN